MKPPQPTGQTMDLGDLPHYWQVIAHEFAALEALPPLSSGQQLSARAFDEAQPAGPRTYMAVTRYLEVARDNHLALLGLLEHHGATLWAPWSLLRPTFETAFLAAWILDPENGRERRARGLQCEVRDAFEQRKHRATFKELPELREVIEANERAIDAGAMTVYRAEAAVLGRKFSTVHQPVNVTDELRTLSFVKDQPELAAFLVATWRQMSGYEHGFGWAMLKGSDSSITAHVPGGADMHLVINDEEFVTASKTTYFLLVTACRLLARRHQQPASA
jgi:hypothetical protein